MTKKIILFFLPLAMIFQGCYKDDTSGANREISNIEVDLGIENKSTIDLGLNEEYSIQPEVIQNKDIPLTYEWEVDHKVVSTDKDFVFSSSRLGTYIVRLKVSNEDGSTFKEFNVRVNSQYEEGLLILGEDASEEGTLSFIPKSVNELLSKTPTSEVDINSFAKSNPGMKIGKKPTDLGIRLLQIFIASEEEGISVINYKTLELEGEVHSPDFPDFKPVNIHIQDDESVSSLVVNRSGKVYSMATLEFLVSNYTLARADTIQFDLKSQMIALPYYTYNYLWDVKNSKLWNYWYYGYSSGDKLKGQKLIHFFGANSKVYVLTADKANPSLIKKTVFGEFITNSAGTSLNVLVDDPAFTNASLTLKYESKTLLDEYYQKLIYANGNKIYKWFYNTNDFPTTPYITLDISGEVTCMEKDPTNKEMYVGVYDANATGLKGSVLVYDLDTGAKKATFANIADKPVKLFFKKRK